MQNGNSRLFRTPQDVGEIVNYKNVIEIIIINNNNNNNKLIIKYIK